MVRSATKEEMVHSKLSIGSHSLHICNGCDGKDLDFRGVQQNVCRRLMDFR